MSEKIAPIEKMRSGMWEVWYADGRAGRMWLDRDDARKMMEELPDGLIGMNYILKKDYRGIHMKNKRIDKRATK